MPDAERTTVLFEPGWGYGSPNILLIILFRLASIVGGCNRNIKLKALAVPFSNLRTVFSLGKNLRD